MKKLIHFFVFVSIAFASAAQQNYNVSFVHDGKTVFGTLTTPNGAGRFAVIIINPGSGANNRDGSIPLTDANSACLFPAMYGDTLHVYKELGDALVASGYAVLRYDKLEYTYSSNIGVITFHKLWLPVESAINYVKTRADIDTNRIILMGHSEGSALIPVIARGRTDVKALISIAGARTPFDSLYAWQLNNLVQLLRPCGATSSDSLSARSQGAQVLSYFNTIRTNTWNAGTPTLFGVPANVWYDYIRATDSVAIYYNTDKLPALFTGLGTDIQVTPAELQRFKNEVSVTPDFWSLAGLTHYMTPNNNPHVSKALSDTIVYWLRQHNLAAGIGNNILEEPSVQAFPNPFSNTLSVVVQKPGMQTVSLALSNTLGQTLSYMKYTYCNGVLNKEIDISDEPEGIYFLDINIDGKHIARKVLKQ